MKVLLKKIQCITAWGVAHTFFTINIHVKMLTPENQTFKKKITYKILQTHDHHGSVLVLQFTV